MLKTVTDKRSFDVMMSPLYKAVIGWNGGVFSGIFLGKGRGRKLYRTIEVDKQFLECGGEKKEKYEVPMA